MYWGGEVWPAGSKAGQSWVLKKQQISFHCPCPSPSSPPSPMSSVSLISYWSRRNQCIRPVLEHSGRTRWLQKVKANRSVKNKRFVFVWKGSRIWTLCASNRKGWDMRLPHWLMEAPFCLMEWKWPKNHFAVSGKHRTWGLTLAPNKASICDELYASIDLYFTTLHSEVTLITVME